MENLYNRSNEFAALPILILLAHLCPTNKNEKQNYSLYYFIPGILNLLFFSVNQKIKEMAVVALLSICSIWDLERIFDWIISKKNLNHQMENKHIQSILILV